MKTLLTTLAIAGVLLTGCAPKSTTATPSSPVLTLAQLVHAASDADNTLVTTVIAARNQGLMSATDAATVENWVKNVGIPTTTGIANEQLTSDTWQVQKTKILTLLATVTAPAAVTQAAGKTPGVAAALAAATTLFQQILQAVQQ